MNPLRPPQYPPSIPPPPRRPRPRYFDEVDTVTGTPEADTFEVEPFAGDRLFPAEIFIPPEITFPVFTNGSNNSEEGEVNILVYQEQERAVYLDRFQAPTARSYTYIEDFEPIEDEIIVGDNPDEIEYEIDNSFMPMFGPTCFRINGEWKCI